MSARRSACEDHQCGGRGQSLITGCRSAIGTHSRACAVDVRTESALGVLNQHRQVSGDNPRPPQGGKLGPSTGSRPSVSGLC
jgi:hypothetical protein